MPIYEYRCNNGHTFEVFQSMSADPVTACEECGAPVERVFHPVAIHFKGSGFHNTDYKKKDAAGVSKDGDSDSGSDGSDGKSESKSDSGSSDKKSDSSKSDSGSKAGSSSSSSD